MLASRAGALWGLGLSAEGLGTVSLPPVRDFLARKQMSVLEHHPYSSDRNDSPYSTTSVFTQRSRKYRKDIDVPFRTSRAME